MAELLLAKTILKEDLSPNDAGHVCSNVEDAAVEDDDGRPPCLHTRAFLSGRHARERTRSAKGIARRRCHLDEGALQLPLRLHQRSLEGDQLLPALLARKLAASVEHYWEMWALTDVTRASPALRASRTYRRDLWHRQDIKPRSRESARKML